MQSPPQQMGYPPQQVGYPPQQMGYPLQQMAPQQVAPQQVVMMPMQSAMAPPSPQYMATQLPSYFHPSTGKRLFVLVLSVC